jgi:hypothetical protein
MALTWTDEGNGVSASSSASVVTGATIDAAVGDWLVALVAASNDGTNGAPSLTGVQDSQGNTWTQRALINFDPGNAGQGATLGIFTAQITNALTGGTVTANFSPNTSQKAIDVYRVQPGAGESVEFVAADTTGSTGNTSTHSAATVSVTNGHTILGAAAIEADAGFVGDSDTVNGNWSSLAEYEANGGPSASSMVIASQFKTVNATGNQTWACTGATADSARSYLILRPVAAQILGTATLTEANDTVSASGTVALTGSASLTQAANTISATGALPIAGTLTATQEGNTLLAEGEGENDREGAAALTQDDQTVSSQGTISLAATASITQAGNTTTATGAVAIVGSSALTQAANTISAAGALAVKGQAVLTQVSNAISAVGVLTIKAVLDLTQADDVLAAIGDIILVGPVSMTPGVSVGSHMSPSLSVGGRLTGSASPANHMRSSVSVGSRMSNSVSVGGANRPGINPIVRH